MKNPTFTAKPSMKSKQRGALTLDAAMWTSFILVAVLLLLSQLPKIKYTFNELIFVWEANQIVTETVSWSKGNNFLDATITKVCTEGNLSKRICGSSNDGRGTNAFGGDWSLKPNRNSSTLLDVTATIPTPEDAKRIPSLAKSLIGSTRGNCSEVDGCSTLATTANSLTMTY